MRAGSPTTGEGIGIGTPWGPKVDHKALSDLYSPQNVSRFGDIPGGIDNLKMTTVDSFLIPGIGELTAVFRGYVRVARAAPTTNDWATSVVYTNMIDMLMYAETEALGPLRVRINPSLVCAGQITTPQTAKMSNLNLPAKNCRIAVSAFFDVLNQGLTLFNKEPILLCIDGITTMPPGGAHGIGRFHNTLPLYNNAEPDGEPAAWLTRLEFDMGDYITPAEKQALLNKLN
jgi:Family of unknown function (DUF6073)